MLSSVVTCAPFRIRLDFEKCDQSQELLGVEVVIPVIVVAFGPRISLSFQSELGTGTEITWGGVAILVTAVALGPSDPPGVSKM